jgi:DNA adenine methylase
MGNGFGPEDQERLRNACVAAVGSGAHVIVSNSTAPLVLDLYAKWSINIIKARRAINSKSDKRGEIDEVVIVMKP